MRERGVISISEEIGFVYGPVCVQLAVAVTVAHMQGVLCPTEDMLIFQPGSLSASIHPVSGELDTGALSNYSVNSTLWLQQNIILRNYQLYFARMKIQMHVQYLSSWNRYNLYFS